LLPVLASSILFFIDFIYPFPTVWFIYPFPTVWFIYPNKNL